MMKRRPFIFAIVLLIFLLVSASLFFSRSVLPLSASQAESSPAPDAFSRYSRKEMGIFDTEITLIAYAQSQAQFDAAADGALARLREYHRMFDGYNGYDDLHNLWYLNRHAGEAPVQVPQPLFDLISFCKSQWADGRHTVNIAMGAVLSVWHDYRAAGMADPDHAQLPPMEELRQASAHTDIDQVILDADNRTVFFADPLLRLDLGAVAKGYAADLVLPLLMEEMPSFLLSLGGNVYAGEPPMDGRAHWGVGVQDPDAFGLQLGVAGTDILDVMYVDSLTVVTSGDYWRYYTVDGERYHHIIDPETLMPSRAVRSVTIVCQSSLLADYLSTTLFVLPYEQGRSLIDGMDGVEAMWVLPDGAIRFTDGMAQYARSLGAK